MKDERPINDDYLWDGSGEPDPEVERLERLLVRFRSTRPVGAPLAAPSPVPARTWVGQALPLLRFWPRFAAAAAALLMAAGVWIAVRRLKPLRPGSRTAPAAETANAKGAPGTGAGAAESGGLKPRNAFEAAESTGVAWEVASLKGAPQIGSNRIQSTGRLEVGQVLETDEASQASISVGEIGEVEVEPGTRLRLVESRQARDLLELQRGTIQAAIWAPPGHFVVDTPSAAAVDLGCVYTLHVDDSGAGLLRTQLGWVGFKLNGREAFIPAGAVCATRPGTGPGTPYFEDAPAALRAALVRLDFDKLTPEASNAELAVVLAQARRRDALTLWHLVERAKGDDRACVYDRFAELVPPPAGVTRDGVLAGDRQMLDLWWNKLGYGNTSLWRTFERSWTSAAP